ncbi:MAG: hypothetical protein ACYCVZ_00395 [Streptosporangiaceae bacterium]
MIEFGTAGAPAPGAGQQAGAPTPGAGQQAGEAALLQAAFRSGWLVSQLYGPALDQPATVTGAGPVGPAGPGGTPSAGPPTVPAELTGIAGLTTDQRVGLYLGELGASLDSIGTATGYQSDLSALDSVPRQGDWRDPFRAELAKQHERTLTGLAARDEVLGRAYVLGASLSDLTCLPADLGTARRQLDPDRVAEIDSALLTLAPRLGADPVTAVRGSLRTWSTWIARPYIGRHPVRRDGNGSPVTAALRRQGSIWHDLLTGVLGPSELLTVDSYLEAADIAVRRVGHAAGRVLLHFWYAVAAVLVAAGGLIYVSLTNGPAVGRFWGVLLTVVGGSAALWRGVRGAVSRLAERASGPLWQVERDDALAAAATRLPVGATAGLIRRRVHQRPFRRPPHPSG